MGLTRPRAYQIFDIDYKQSVRVVTVSNVTLSGGAPSQVDGVSLSLNDRVLVTAQSTGSQNGLYYVTTVGTGSNGTWARSVDGNETGEIDAGMIVMVTEGAIYADTQWKLTTNDPIVIGSTALTFVQNYSANSISAGTSNVTVTSNANVSIAVAGSNVAVFTSGGPHQFTGNLNPTSNITYSLGNTGSRWKDIWLANSSIYLGNVTLSADATQLLVNGSNVVTSAGGAMTLTGNITGGNLVTGGAVSATGAVSGSLLYSLQSLANEGGEISLALPSSGSTLVGNVIIDVYQNRIRFFEGGGTARGAYIDLTAAAAGAGTNLLAGAGGTPGGSNTYVQFNDAGSFGGNGQFVYDKVTNTLTAGIIAANNNGAGTNFKVGDDAWIGDINAADTMRVMGQQNAANAYIVFGNTDGTALGRAGSGPLTYGGAFTATGNITGGNLSGTSIAGTLTTAAQTNITSVGTLGSLAVTANITGGNANISGRILVGSGNAAAPGITFSADTGQDTGFYWISDGNIGISTNGTLRVTVSNTGNVTATGNISGGNVIATTFVGTLSGAATSATTAGTVTTAAQPNITSVGTLSSLTVTANVTGGNLITAGQVSATGNITGGNIIANGRPLTSLNATNIDTGTLAQARLANSAVTLGSTALTLGSTVTTVAGLTSVTSTTFVGALTGAATSAATAGTVTTAAQPNITSIGTLSSLSVTANITGGNLITAGLLSVNSGNVTGTVIVNAGANGVGNIGSATGYFNTAHVKATSAQYADLAEMYVADADYAPGTVVEFGGTQEITQTTSSCSTAVAGIISTNPSYLMNSCQPGEFVLPVALTGRVPCQVQGPVKKGDVLISSNIPGVAQRIGANWQPGCTVGKSMEVIETNEVKIIEVAVGRL